MSTFIPTLDTVKLQRKFNSGDTWEGIPGWLDGTTKARLLQLGKEAHFIVNLGVWKGLSVAALASVTPGVVYAIDHWLGSPSSRDGTMIEAADSPLSVYVEFLAYMQNFNWLYKKVVPICAESVYAAQYFPNESVDLVFVDASHDEEDVYKDNIAWGIKVTRGGTLCGHDWNWGSVRKGVERYIAHARELGYGKLEIDEPIWIMRRI